MKIGDIEIAIETFPRAVTAPQKTLRDLMTYLSGFAKQMIAKRGTFHAMWFIDVPEAHVVVSTPNYSNHRAVTVATICGFLAEFKAERYVMVCEAWALDTATLANESEEFLAELRAGKSISDHPARIEVISFMGEDYQVGTLGAHCKIIRPQGEPVRLEPIYFLDIPGGQPSGRVVGLLPPRGSRQ